MSNETFIPGFGNQPYFNKFINLDSIETRIINYIRDTDTPEAQRIWKLLKYSDMKALYKKDLSKKEKDALIYKDTDENSSRVFNFGFIEDNFTETCSLLKVYVDSIYPMNHLTATVNVRIDILSHNKLSNVYNDNGDPADDGRPVEEDIAVKNRNTVLLRSLIAILNGANIEGVGVLQFNRHVGDEKKAAAEMKLSNRRDYYGYSVVFSCNMSGVGDATNGY